MIAKNAMIAENQSMESILTRDQRTTSHRVHDHATQIYAPTSESAASSSQQTKYQDDVVARRRCTTAKMQKLGHAQRHLPYDSHLMPTFYHDRRTRRSNASFSVSDILRLGSTLVLLLVLSAASNPVMNSQNEMDEMKWVNPCGVSTKLRTDDSNPDIAQLEDQDLLNRIVVQATTALTHAKRFRDDFIRQTFKTNFSNFHAMWKGSHYAWLPTRHEIPKELGEKLDKEYLDKLNIDTSLLDAYEYMQKYAVGLEQVVMDQKDYQPTYHKKFKEAEGQLRAVLCELQGALAERSVPRRPDVTRDIMTPDFRQMTSLTFRDLRTWLIFREYMNGLEYVIQVFQHLRQQLQSES